MPHDTESRDASDLAREEFREVMMNAFCSLLQTTRLPPMTVLAMAAEAVGSIYREVADAHRDDGACPCGWRPLPEADVLALQAALALSAAPPLAFDLHRIAAAGRA